MTHRSIRERWRQILQRLRSRQINKINVLQAISMWRDWYLDKNKTASVAKKLAKVVLTATQVSIQNILQAVTCEDFFREQELGKLKLCPRLALTVSGGVVLLGGVTWPCVVTGWAGVIAGGLEKRKNI